MMRVSMATTIEPMTGDDPRTRSGYEDRDVMNERTKSETGASALGAPSKARPGAAPLPATEVGDEAVSGKRPSRTRAAEPYLTWLGQSLRQSYEETLNEPVPNAFGDLLDRLEQEDDGKPSR